MDAHPDTPSYNPPPVPTNNSFSDARNAHFTHPLYQLPIQQIPLQRTANYEEEDPIIPDSILHEIAKLQYKKTLNRLYGQHSKKYDILSLLESSEQFLEEAKKFLGNHLYQKAATSYIKGFTVFKFADRLNRNPSNADIISTLRHLYTDPSFIKLKDIVDEKFTVERQKDFYRMASQESSSVTLVDSQSQLVNDNFKAPTLLESALPASVPLQIDTAPTAVRTLDPQTRPLPHNYHEIAKASYLPSNEFPLYDTRASLGSAPTISPPPLPQSGLLTMNRPHQPSPGPRERSHFHENGGRNSYHNAVYDRPKFDPLQSGHSICGLQNFGNTCYLNSLIQCLYNMSEFNYFFKSNTYVDYVHPVKGKSSDVCLSYGLGSLFRVMEKHSGSTIAPTRFFGFLLRISDFQRNEQQDVQEALVLILSRLHEELSDNNLVPIYFPDTLTRYSDNPEYEKWFDAKLKNEKLSPVNAFFEGQQESSLRCETCGFSSKSYSCFNVLSLNLPPTAVRGQGALAIEELMNFYISTEMLTGIDSWDCPECKKKRDVEVDFHKQRMLRRHEEETKSILNNSTSDLFEAFDAPKEKRSKLFFKKKSSKGASNGADASSKLLDLSHQNEIREFEEQIRFATRDVRSFRSTKFLSLPSYLVIHIQRSVKGARLSTNIKYPLILKVPLESGKVCRYKLQSTVNHSGNSPNSGHYTALCNKSDHVTSAKWCYFNDDHFTIDLSHSDIVKGVKRLTSPDVYLLFYERIES